MGEVRSATAGDIDAIVELWDVAAGPTRLTSDATAAQRLLERDADALLVIDRDGVVVGTLVIGWDGWRCHLYRMAVEPSHRRNGLASMLLDEAVRRARALGARRMDAMVSDGNDDGRSFWAALGFEVDAEDSRWTCAL